MWKFHVYKDSGGHYRWRLKSSNGQTVAAWLKAEQEATLKRFYLEEGRVRLQPANSTMSPIYTDPENVEIKGRVVGVIRRLD